jgi:hypothetical protein
MMMLCSTELSPHFVEPLEINEPALGCAGIQQGQPSCKRGNSNWWGRVTGNGFITLVFQKIGYRFINRLGDKHDQVV